MNYYERYCGDYGRDTAHLDLQEHGAYTLLLDTYYATERPLPEPYDALYRICRAMSKGEQSAVRGVADEFFPIGPDGLRHNPRADREIADAGPRIEAARINGRRGGRPPHEKPNGLSREKPNGLADRNPSAKLSIHQTPEDQEQRQKQRRGDFAPPGWVPREAWLDFDEMRRAKSGKAWTERAKALAVRKLHELAEAGHDPTAVLEQSVASSWVGLFPISGGRFDTAPRPADRAKRNIDILTGKVRDERVIQGAAQRVGGASVLPFSSDLREPDADDVGPGGPGRSATGVG